MGTARLLIPTWNIGLYGGISTTSAVLDAPAEKVAVIGRAHKTGNISTVKGFCMAVATGGGNPVYDVRIETVDKTTGRPTGTLWATNTNATLTVSATGAWSVTLTADAAVTAGDEFAVVVSATTVGGTQNATFQIAHASAWSVQFPYALSDTGAGWSVSGNMPAGQLAVYSDGDPVHGVSLSSPGTEQYNSSSTPDERGNRWNFDQSMRIHGLAGFLRPGASSTHDLILADSGGTELAKLNFDGDVHRVTSSEGLTIGRFSSPVTIPAATDFHTLLRPNTTTNHRIVVHTFPSSSDRSLLEPNAVYASRTDNGAISTDAAKFACIWPLIEVPRSTPGFAFFG
ncbi:MAG: hypothetical protein ACK4WH_01050 [Phycisphaerales bacterium]